MSFCNQMVAAIDGARTLTCLDHLSRSIWQGLAAGAVGDDDAQALAERLHARRRVLSGLAPPPLADEGSVGYRAAPHEGVDEDAVLGMWIAGRDGAARAHRPGLSSVPLPRVRQAVQ